MSHIYKFGGNLQVNHSTITGNSATFSGLGRGGGGIFTYASIPPTATINHTIVAGNFQDDFITQADIRGPIAAEYSLIGDKSFATITDNGGNLIGTAASPIDPLLAPLSDNGGPTLTHALLPGSPAIDAGDPAAVAGMGGVPQFDQRGSPFDRVEDGDGGGGVRIDMGAFEKATPIVVSTLVDESDGDFAAGDLSLREAIELANLVPDPNEIRFAAALTSGGLATIMLTLGELTITDPVSIDGPGADLLTVDASGNDPTPTVNDHNGSRVFDIDDGDSGTLIPVDIIGLTLTGGDVSGNGGAIRTIENLTVKDSNISGNSASGHGAGIAVGYAELTVVSSTVAGNSTSGYGGGIHADHSNVTVTGSTISGNLAVGAFASGGGIFSSYGTLTVTSSTISGNSADLVGGGIVNYYGSLTIRHSTISGNRADTENNGYGVGGGIIAVSFGLDIVNHTILAGNTRGLGARDDIAGAITAEFSIIGDKRDATITDFGGNQIGTTASPINPQLGPLADNGGPTLTHALLFTSPAIDAGDPAAVAGVGGVPLFDQRGDPFSRVVGNPSPLAARIDIGAYENQAARFIVDILADESDMNFSAGDLSLREAIERSNLNPDLNAIVFAAALTSGGPATIALSPVLVGGGGQLTITTDLSIHGPGASLLTIDASGNDPTPDSTLNDGDPTNDGDGSRVFNIDDASSGTLIDVELVGLTLTGGDALDAGGAIRTLENLTVKDSNISGNSASGDGAGIAVGYAELTVVSTTISVNSAGYNGGGIRNESGNVTITGSTISGNTSRPTGGGIASGGGNLTVIDSTIRDNVSLAESGFLAGGGGIWFSGLFKNLGVINSTISGNTAGVSGGGIFVYEGSLALTHCTITSNIAASGLLHLGSGGGIRNAGQFGSATATLDHTIVAGNIRLFGVSGVRRDDISGEAAARFSLVGDSTGASITDNGGNVIGTSELPIDALLGPLADNGGPTMTHALLSDSPAIDAGDPAAVAGVGGVPEFDQRGAPFERVRDGDAPEEVVIDIGAFEVQSFMPGPALLGDYNQNGVVDAADYVFWRKTLGTSGVPAYSGADGDGDGMIDQDDYGVWRENFGETLPLGAGSTEQGAGSGGQGAVVGQAVPDVSGSRQAEPDLRVLAQPQGNVEVGAARQVRRGESPATSSGTGTAELRIADFPPRRVDFLRNGESRESRRLAAQVPRSRESSVESQEPARLRDAALLAWLTSQSGERNRDAVVEGGSAGKEDAEDAADELFEALDAALETLVNQLSR
ncbi:MAG: hypothetical protein L0228_02655 [Planctomycetes bacterium]|nr:hypothetical protein [Planctomycetota bacterium]